MPYLHIAIGKPVSRAEQDALYTRCAQLISILPEKNEENCMVRIEQDCATYFKGAACPCAFVDLRLYTQSPEDKKRAFVAALSGELCQRFGLSPSHIYMNLLELDHWVVGDSLK